MFQTQTALPSTSAAESYSVAGSDGNISPTAGSGPHQASGSSSPCSHSPTGGPRHPVSALKRWLSYPVRKLSFDARGGAGKAERQMCRSDDRLPPLLLSHSETQQKPQEPQHNYSVVPSEETVRHEDLAPLSGWMHGLIVWSLSYLLSRCGKMVHQVQELLL